MKKGFILITGLLVAFVSWLAYFFIANEAPIIKGKLDYNIEYKEGLFLDVYQPTTVVYEKTPVVIYVHGGAWIGGSKMTVNNNRFNKAFNTLREQGYAIVSPDYTVADEFKSPFPACITDVEDAIAWIKLNAETYNFDLDNLGIFGESAGGHIAMMIAFPDTAYYALDYQDTPFNYVIDVYGPTDLEGIYKSELADSLDKIVQELPAPIASNLNIAPRIFGFDPKTDTIRAQGVMRTYSPIHFLGRKIPPVLIIHGNEDQVVPLNQSLLLKKHLDSLNIPSEMHILDKVNHGFIGANEAQMAEVQTWISDFILSHYKENKRTKTKG